MKKAIPQPSKGGKAHTTHFGGDRDGCNSTYSINHNS